MKIEDKGIRDLGIISSCLSMSPSSATAAETQRIEPSILVGKSGFLPSLCHIRVRTVQLAAYVVVTSSDLDTSRNKASVQRTFMDK